LERCEGVEEMSSNEKEKQYFKNKERPSCYGDFSSGNETCEWCECADECEDDTDDF
jgi:hypothetical protein